MRIFKNLIFVFPELIRMDTFNAGRKLVRIPKDVTSFSNRATRVPNVVSHAKVFFEKYIISDVFLTRNEKKMFQFSL